MRLRSRFSLLLGTLWMACASSFARASVLALAPDCSATGGGWPCYLPGIHRFLVVIAIILGLILTAVIVLAVKSYLKLKENDKV